MVADLLDFLGGVFELFGELIIRAVTKIGRRATAPQGRHILAQGVSPGYRDTMTESRRDGTRSR